jgi:hypothetical protein
MIQKQQEEFSGLGYEEVLDSWESHNTQSAKVHIQILCDRLRRKYTLYTNKDIRKQVMKDVLKRDLCSQARVSQSWPDWVKKEKILETNIFDVEEKTLRSESIIEEYKAVDERALEEPEPEEEPSKVTVTGIGTNEKYTPTPMEMYEDSIHAFDRAWQSLTNKNHIIPAGGAVDVQNILKTSRKLRLRLFKGLDKQRAIYFHNMLVSMEMLIKDSLDMWDELKLEDTSKEIQQ